MWNQNGNGQGNGYGQQPQQGYQQQAPQNQGYAGGDVYERLNNSREIGGARFPYIEGGMHKLALVVLEEFGDANQPKVRAVFKTLESRTQQVGGFCVKIWSLTKPAKFPNSPTEADEFADFCRKLKGAPPQFPIAPSIRTLMKERPREQLARGTVIECNGVPNKTGTYVRVYWKTVPQAPEAIIAMRQRLEQEGIPSTTDDAPQQPAQNQYQGAPHPAQMQYQQPAPQQGYVQQPAQQYRQPAPQQGYVQQPAQQPVQGPPPGGYLQNVPTNNGGQQGGGW